MRLPAPGGRTRDPVAVGVADRIVCVDCGGTCHRTPLDAPDAGWQAGDVVTYRCGDCADVWYLEVHEDDAGEDAPGAGPWAT